MRPIYTFIATMLCLVGFSTIAEAQQTRYLDPIFDSVDVVTIKYGQNTNYQGDTIELFMDIYTPKGDTATNRPLALIAHGGSFTGGSRDISSMRKFSTYIARCGYVCASISYRLTGFLQLGAEETVVQTVVRAVQDGKAAIRYFRKDAANGNTYGIDSTHVYMGGESAGGILAYQLGYMNDMSKLPSNWVGYVNAVGGLEGESGTPGYRSKVQGVFGYAGGVADTSWMLPDDIPFMGMHSENDATVPYAKGQPLGFVPIPIFGTSLMDVRANNVGIDHDYYSYTGSAHPPYSGSQAVYDSTGPYTVEFLYKAYTTGPTLEPLTGIANRHVTSANSLLVYPNPNNGSFVLRTGLEGKYDVRIYNALGQEIKTLSGDTKEMNISLDQIDRGLYFIRVYKPGTQNSLLTTKFFVH